MKRARQEKGVGMLPFENMAGLSSPRRVMVPVLVRDGKACHASVGGCFTGLNMPQDMSTSNLSQDARTFHNSSTLYPHHNMQSSTDAAGMACPRVSSFDVDSLSPASHSISQRFSSSYSSPRTPSSAGYQYQFPHYPPSYSSAYSFASGHAAHYPGSAVENSYDSFSFNHSSQYPACGITSQTSHQQPCHQWSSWQ